MVHKVRIKVGRTFDYGTNACIRVKRNDKIEWELKHSFAWGIVVKAPITPLDWSFKRVGKGQKIRATVRRTAGPGCYPYAVIVFNGKELLIDDPDIIVRPPDGNY